MCCNVLQCHVFAPTFDEHWPVLQCVAVRCSVLQCGVVWCSVLQCDAVSCLRATFCEHGSVLQCVEVCCSVLQCVAVCCSVVCLRDLLIKMGLLNVIQMCDMTYSHVICDMTDSCV